jgi:hypothetical protein
MHSCTQWGTYECSELKVPENIPPIDPDAYNSVDAVYWNYYLQFADLKNKPDTFVTVNGDTLISEHAVRDTVKVYGWFTNKRTHSTIHDNNKPDRHMSLEWANEDVYQKLQSIDFSKKIFAKGIITASPSDPCPDHPWVRLMIMDVNDIYAE